MDAQRLFLHAAYEASEDASYVPNSSSGYAHNLWVKIDVYYSTGKALFHEYHPTDIHIIRYTGILPQRPPVLRHANERTIHRP
jgi:acyl transferase domain-containing protein